MMQATAKKKQAHHKNDNVLEALGSVPASVGTNTIAEFGTIASDIANTLLGGISSSGELKPNQAIEFGGEPAHEQAPAPIHTEVHAHPNIGQIEMETRQQLDAIRAELKALAVSLKTLHQDVQAAVSQEVVDPGIYHINFYEQLRAFIMVLRQQIEDSRSWLAAFTTRKKKMGYWGMYKKHGTTFGLSNERSLATAAG